LSTLNSRGKRSRLLTVRLVTLKIVGVWMKPLDVAACSCCTRRVRSEITHQYLFGQAELTDHVREVKAAEKELASTTAQLSSLGITD
jgi:hypothetical protein